MSRKSKLDKSMIVWKKELVRNPEIQALFTWGRDPFRKSGDTKTLEKKIKKAEVFSTKLAQFCKTFKFEISDPKYIKPTAIKWPANWYLPAVLDCGQIDTKVGEGLVGVFSENQKYIKKLQNDLNVMKNRNPIRLMKTPTFLAYHVILGLDLFKESEIHLIELKSFIETGGDFEKMIKDRAKFGMVNLKIKKQIESCFISKKSEKPVMDWAGIKRQTMINALFSDRSKKVTKARGGDDERNKIESEAAKRLKVFKEKILKGTLP